MTNGTPFKMERFTMTNIPEWNCIIVRNDKFFMKIILFRYLLCHVITANIMIWKHLFSIPLEHPLNLVITGMTEHSPGPYFITLKCHCWESWYHWDIHKHVENSFILRGHVPNKHPVGLWCVLLWEHAIVNSRDLNESTRFVVEGEYVWYNSGFFYAKHANVVLVLMKKAVGYIWKWNEPS